MNKEIVGIRLRLATPDQIRELSHGEVKKPETINYRTLRPERDGLFCERIFGPTKSYECACGKYKKSGPKFKGVVCDRCSVEVTDNRVRRERMGHIELAAPVVHIWYLRGIPSRLSLLLGTPTKMLERVVYFAPLRKREAAYKIVIEGKRPDLAAKDDVISESEMRVHAHYDPKFKAEEAYRILSTDDVPLAAGDVISANQLARYQSEWGEDSFSAEPAYTILSLNGVTAGDVSVLTAAGLIAETRVDHKWTIGDNISESDLAALREDGNTVEAERRKTGSQDSYVVTSVTHLPYSKGQILSQSEHTLFQEKYPHRFTSQLESVVVEDPCYLVIDEGESPFSESDIIIEREQYLCSAYDPKFKAGIGAEGVREKLCAMNLNHLVQELREELSETTGQKRRKIVKRLQVVEDFRKGDCAPQSMVLEVLPVIPPDLRPMVQLDGGRFATSDLNDLYRRVINRNNRLSKLKELKAPEIIIRNEKRMLQESVDALIDNGRMGKAVLGAGNRPLKSLTDLLRGKKGRFRQNLLGKRVDYSGRSVIAIGPFLRLYQCGLPKQMALELFKPFVIQKMVEKGIATNVKNGKRMIERGNEEIWGILEEIIKDHPVMLNRAPTLHRLGIQAFEPILMEGKAIRLHPMACTAFNADFDGDQMAVHVPLSIEAQTEARMLMLAANNLLSPASGKPIVSPTQDILLGVYYITNMVSGLKGENTYYDSLDDVMTALDHGAVHVNTRIYLRWDPEWKPLTKKGMEDSDFLDPKTRKWLITSPGRALFNLHLNPRLRFVNFQMGKKDLSAMLDKAYDYLSHIEMVDTLDSIKNLGYHWACLSGLSFQMQAIVIPPEKQQLVNESLDVDGRIRDQYEMGILTEDEYLRQKEELWSGAAGKIGDSIMDHMAVTNPIRMMVESGARGSRGQLAQMAGIRGLMADPTGRIIDYPITTNFREGMNMLEYFISTHGARKGLADTALRTAKSGYLTRRLVDVAQDIIVLEEDCHTSKGIKIEPMKSDGKVVIPLSERIAGRTSLEDIDHPVSGERIVSKNELISPDKALEIENIREHIWVRSPLSCESPYGICRKCYGVDLSSRKMVNIGEAVGVVAAQSIGEPGTQLTMRTFHTGGVRISGEDITQGLPRIEQLFEARRPKKVSYLAGLNGKVAEVRELEGKRKVIIEGTPNDSDVVQKVTYSIPASQSILVEEGDEVKSDTLITDGYIDPQQLLEVEGQEAVQKYLVDSIQEVYRSQGVSINNKHIEVILRKVAPINRLRVIDEGDTSLVAGDLVWASDVQKEIDELTAENERNLEEAVKALSGKIFLGQEGVHPTPEITSRQKTVIDRPLVEELLKAGTPMTKLHLLDGDCPLDVIVGEASFRARLKGFQPVEPITCADGTVIPNSCELTLQDLTRITATPSEPHFYRDVETLRKLTDAAYLAKDVSIGGKVIARTNDLVSGELVQKLSGNPVRSIRIWKNVQHIDVIDYLQERLISTHWGKLLSAAFDAEGNPVPNMPRIVDASVIRAILQSKIKTLALHDSDRPIHLDEYLAQALINAVVGKVTLDVVDLGEGKGSIPAGVTLTEEHAARIIAGRVPKLSLRPASPQSEEVALISRVSYVRKLRVPPLCKKFIHGITKAALATESFLSAASFQQTAQILAGAAVRSQVDHLMGLKENVIIGHLIPAGTGIERFQSLKVSSRFVPAAEAENADDASEKQLSEGAEVPADE
ncbi:DNA-directed RNA polymerase subunit beta' [Pyramidobacter piscolens]|uniref:DNA-directed RNA polymerase subunit beta' n=1 Tax=Pyramidobacter piscolens TaxID=638849 RepID=UPI001FCC6AC7|nr:DNA-directed RNA polymerase subunit beta' [Pyramidobacter piscolens]BDF77791.1 DNA-directed RNA polymerase subunit beta' [Pyramidobacter piscolens]